MRGKRPRGPTAKKTKQDLILTVNRVCVTSTDQLKIQKERNKISRLTNSHWRLGRWDDWRRKSVPVIIQMWLAGKRATNKIIRADKRVLRYANIWRITQKLVNWHSALWSPTTFHRWRWKCVGSLSRQQFLIPLLQLYLGDEPRGGIKRKCSHHDKLIATGLFLFRNQILIGREIV